MKQGASSSSALSGRLPRAEVKGRPIGAGRNDALVRIDPLEPLEPPAACSHVLPGRAEPHVGAQLIRRSHRRVVPVAQAVLLAEGRVPAPYRAVMFLARHLHQSFQCSAASVARKEDGSTWRAIAVSPTLATSSLRPARMARRSPILCSWASGSGTGRWDWIL